MAGDEAIQLREGAVTWREVNDEIIVLALENSTYLQINGSGTVLWKLLAAGATASQLAQALVDRFGIEMVQAEGDAGAFVADLRDRGLLDP